MEFYESLPLRNLTKKNREKWAVIYADRGRPEGHTVSSNNPETVCECSVCKKFKTNIKWD